MIGLYMRRSPVAVTSSHIRRARALLLVLLLCTTGAASAADITLTANTQLSKEGYFVLSWQTTNAADTTIVLQQASTAAFEPVSELIVPLNGAHTITGLADGEYWFRAGSTTHGWSNAVNVDVAHHSLPQALAFFGLGLVLFVILCGVIVSGANIHGEPR